MGLKSVKSLDVSRILRISYDFLSMKDACVLVNDLVFDNCAGCDGYFGADDAVLDYCAFLDDNAAADDAVLNCSGNKRAVGDKRLLA